MHLKDLYNLKGKRILITGGSRGLGLMMAEGAAEAGADVVICARNLKGCEEAAEKIRRLGVRCLPLPCDVSDEASVVSMAATAEVEFGRIDVLVNNAGIAGGGPLEKMSLQQWQELFAINATGTFLCTREIGRQMIRNGGGKIINVVSTAGISTVDPGIGRTTAYGASKAAIVMFTKNLAREWSRHNITVNAIAPGYFRTDLAEPLIKHRWDNLMGSIHLKRVGEYDDMKGIVPFLASDAAGYMTGHILTVDGGVSV